MKERAPDELAVRKGYDIGLDDVDQTLLEYQKIRADRIKERVEQKGTSANIMQQHSSRMYNRQEILNEIGFNLLAL